MHIRMKKFSLGKIVFCLLMVVIFLLTCLAGTLIFSARQNRSLVNQYVSETTGLYADQLGKEIDVMRVEMMDLLASGEDVNALPRQFDSTTSSAFQVLKRISEQLRIQAIWHDIVYGYFEYIQSANALITSTGTKFSHSIRTPQESYLMAYLPEKMAGRQNSLYHDFVEINDQKYLLTWYVKGGKAAGNLIELERIFQDLEDCAKEYKILPYIYDENKRINIFPQNVSEEEIREFEEGKIRQTNLYRYSIRGLGDLCIYVLPGNGVLQIVNQWEWILIALLILCILVCAAIIAIYIRQILRPLKRFVNSLDELDTDKYLNDNSTNNLLELESANEQFRILIRKIQALKITIYEKELSEKQIELEFAQEQIRPHFFLNCISLIHGIADNKGEKDIVTITSILSDYIRYIYKGSKVLRPLREELDHVKNYISIQKFRYGEDYFQFDCMVDEGLAEFEIPVLLLQTLVENSFSHGLTPGRKGEISLFVTKETYEGGGCLYLCVSDNGKGFAPEILSKIENEEEIYYNNRRHVGLLNIKKRLKLIYGEKASFHLSNMDEGFGAISEIRIPIREETAGEIRNAEGESK